MVQENEISDLLLDAKSIHIIGSGLNSERPAHRAIHDLDGLGWRLVPVHVRDAGATIRNIPIRKEIDEGIKILAEICQKEFGLPLQIANS